MSKDIGAFNFEGQADKSNTSAEPSQLQRQIDAWRRSDFISKNKTRAQASELPKLIDTERGPGWDQWLAQARRHNAEDLKEKGNWFYRAVEMATAAYITRRWGGHFEAPTPDEAAKLPKSLVQHSLLDKLSGSSQMVRLTTEQKAVQTAILRRGQIKQFGLLAGSAFGEYYLDKLLFPRDQTLEASLIADSLISPTIASTGANWWQKTAAITAVHLAGKLIDHGRQAPELR